MQDKITSIAILDTEALEFARLNQRVSERTAARAAQAHREKEAQMAKWEKTTRIARSVLILTATLAINVWDLINPALGLAAVIAAAVQVGKEVNRK